MKVLEGQTPSERVFDYIMEKVVIKEWKPYTKIMSEKELGDELNVSRISVRQALDKLVALGILVKKKGSGTVVQDIKPQVFFKSLIPALVLNENDIKSIIEFRIPFEQGNVEMFIKNYDEDRVKRLREIHENMKKSYSDPEEFHLHDFYFHKEIAYGTGNQIVISISETLHSILKFNIKQLYTDVGPDIAMEFHEEILNAIENRDKELAPLLMRRHLEATLQKLE
ncbi:FadR/GntR family transcriptional regulator [Planomicrobium sp. CPCC 101079]|uniref:FadR/GntR family transcriptional regulator n=1 Tax=Planomicrobium sp. CPCC 101079 TaxID=2599618 RepID=UPI0011B58548|nr:FCD domain-containing protein [Planomicrobium sp. CPCC 101079]TWT01763.1 FadR family transcriptional regulator [Planomicrobium sp. CPCC 101079]